MVLPGSKGLEGKGQHLSDRCPQKVLALLHAVGLPAPIVQPAGVRVRHSFSRSSAVAPSPPPPLWGKAGRVFIGVQLDKLPLLGLLPGGS